jgi:hypothetical protein
LPVLPVLAYYAKPHDEPQHATNPDQAVAASRSVGHGKIVMVLSRCHFGAVATCSSDLSVIAAAVVPYF